MIRRFNMALGYSCLVAGIALLALAVRAAL